MPELPEVETIKQGLGLLIINNHIKNVQFDWPKSFPNSPVDVASYLIGAHVIATRRRAKVLIIDLSSGYSLAIHLKMTGQIVFRGQESFGAGHPSDSLVGELPDKSTRVTIDFSDGSQLFFNDQRKFGWMKLIPTPQLNDIAFMKRLGPEPLENDFTATAFIARFTRKKRSNIKAALLDQSVVAGIGNIYADEALWAAKIHPRTIVDQLTIKQLTALLKHIRAIMNLSIQHGGSSDRNYIDAQGKKGSYLTFAQVFRRDSQACPRCGHDIIKIRVAARGTHICPHCQKEGARAT